MICSLVCRRLPGLLIVAFLVAPLAAAAAAQQEAAQLYQKAYELILQDQWVRADPLLRDVLSRFPGSRWADDAQFWLCFSIKEQQSAPDASFKCFQDFLESHDDSNYADDAKAQMIAIARESRRPELLQQVREMEEGRDDDLVLMALSALEDLGDVEALSAIRGVYTGAPERTRRYVVHAVSDFEGAEARQFLMKVALEDASMDVRRTAIHALADSDPSPELLQFFQNMVRTEQDLDLRRLALLALGEMEHPDSLSFLAEIALGSNADLARTAVAAMQDFEGEPAVKALQEVYERSEDPDIRRMALRLVGDTEHPAGLALLRKVALEEADGDLRRIALSAIGDLDSQEATEVLHSLARDSRDPDLRRYAIRALEDSPGEGTMALLSQLLEQDKDPNIRRDAAYMLGELGKDAAVSVLKKAALTDESTAVRRSAVRALGEIDSPASRQALVDLLKQRPE